MKALSRWSLSSGEARGPHSKCGRTGARGSPVALCFSSYSALRACSGIPLGVKVDEGVFFKARTLFLARRLLCSSPRMAGFVLAVLAFPFLASPVQAACGDYVHIQTDDDKSAQTQPMDGKQPCDGPNCSTSRGHTPLQPAAAPASSGVYKIVSLLESIATVPQISRVVLVNVSAWPSVHPFGLERPPRITSGFEV